MRSMVRKAVLCGASALAFSAAGQAAAQAPAVAAPPASTAVEEVVVTARQRAENLKDVPASISVLTAQALAAAGVTRADKIVGLTPGVSIVNASAEQGDTQVSIRGVNSARDAGNSFAFVLDGIQIANSSAFNREYTDLSQIEVVKGPQGAVYGRNAEAGAIIVTTDKPSDQFGGAFQASGGNYGTYTVKGRVSGAIAPNLRASLSGDYRHTDGEFKNSLYTSQRNLDSFEGWNINGRVIWDIDPATTLDTKIRYGELDAGSINFNAIFSLPLFASALGNPDFNQDVNKHKFVFQNNVENTNTQQSFEVSTKLDHDFGWAKLTSWLLYSKIDNDLTADGTSASFGFFNTQPLCVSSTAALSAAGVKLPSPTFLAPTPGASLFGAYTPTTCDGYQYQKRNQEDVSFEVRLASPSDQRLRWLAGAYFLHIDREVGVATGIDSGGAPPASLFVPRGQPYATEQLLNDNFTSNIGAVFGQLQYDIVKGVEGSLALRYDSEDRSVHNLVPTAARNQYIDYNGPPYTGGAPLNPGLDPTLNPGGIRDQSKTYDQLQPKVGLRWTIDPQWTVYGDWGIGFKSGGFNNQGSRATINAFINPVRTAARFAPVNISDDYKKEVSYAGEIGVKGRLFDGRLTIDASIYDNQIDNSQFFEFFVGPFGLLRVVSNIDKVQLDGAELGLKFKATSELTFEGAANYTYSRIEKNSVRPDTVGNKAPYTPDYTWNVAAQYDHPIFADTKLHARVDVRGTGPTWFHVVQNQPNPTVFELSFGALGRGDFSRTQRSAFTTVDLRIGLERHGWTLTAYAQNLFDKRYLAEVIPAPEFGGAFASPAEGGRYGVELGVKF